MDRTSQVTEAPDGRTLVFAEWGDLGGEPVFVLHGTPGCRLTRFPKQSKINNSGLPSACRLLPGWYGRFVGFWPDGVVPVRVEAVAVDRQGFHLLLGVDEASGVFTGIQLGSDGQPGGCGGG